MSETEIPGTMQAITVTDDEDGPRLKQVEVPVPQPGACEVLLRVRAFGINNAELLSFQGIAPRPPGGILGLEAVGDVVARGPGVDGSLTGRFGQRMAALLRAGSYAEYVVVPEECLLPVPPWMDDQEAAALPEALAAAWWNLVIRGGLASGDRLLIRGGAGGVGSVAVQLAAALGAQVTTTARAQHAQPLRELGALSVVDYASPGSEKQLHVQARGGYDIVLDNLGGPMIKQNLELLAPGGRLVVLGMQAGSAGELDIAELMAKGASVSSSSLGKLSDDQRAGLCAEVREQVSPLLVEGKIRGVVDSRFTWPEVPAAYEKFSAPGKVGKVVVCRDL